MFRKRTTNDCCLDGYRFSMRKSSKYPKVLALPKERKDATLLDIGARSTLKAFALKTFVDDFHIIYSGTGTSKISV